MSLVAAYHHESPSPGASDERTRTAFLCERRLAAGTGRIEAGAGMFRRWSSRRAPGAIRSRRQHTLLARDSRPAIGTGCTRLMRATTSGAVSGNVLWVVPVGGQGTVGLTVQTPRSPRVEAVSVAVAAAWMLTS